MRRGIFFICCLAIIASACKTKKTLSTTKAGSSPVLTLAKEEKSSEGKNYNPSRQRFHDLLHTKLELSFNYEKEEVYGQATLKLKPYFYASDLLELDAKGFEIKEIFLIHKNGSRDSLPYEYDQKLLRIKLNKKYQSNETYSIFINYIARPGLLEAEGSKAITDARGLYFINPQGKEKKKPRQIWTQGETESSSCWFPTIDAPNEKMTQEVYLTVAPENLTLSNGELVYSSFNADGSRTDCWKQDQPHAPYLAMIAIGKFAVVKDHWRDSVEVNYYVEEEYKPYARMIFGNTPEMMEFFSKKLGVDYPWKKFSQIVVRDYVSGAMENTSAVVHGEFLQQDARALQDETYEDVISHELFHHWFGDLVTAESWANLPLNESFATYGEYLWREYKYGKDDADAHRAENFMQYLYESFREPKKLIRYYYKNREDMFDSHSYQKGGLVLHALRAYVGDTAFFQSLKVYLEKRKFKTAEIHDLRMAFEEVTGEDLNWFFDQWFFAKGHPQLEVSSRYLAEERMLEIEVEQKQDTAISPLFKLPLEVRIVKGQELRNERLWVEGQKSIFKIPLSSEPELVLFDPENVLPATKTEFKSTAEWALIYDRFSSFVLRKKAFNQLTNNWTGDSLQMRILRKAMHDPLWMLRESALRMLQESGSKNIEPFRAELKNMTFSDPKASVRREALQCLYRLRDPSLYLFFVAAHNDSSYQVSALALKIIFEYSVDTAVLIAELNKESKNSIMRDASAEILASEGKGDYQAYFEDAYEAGDWSRFYYYASYLKRVPAEKQERGLLFLESAYKRQQLKKDYHRDLLNEASQQLDHYFKKMAESKRSEAEKLKKTDATRLIYEAEARRLEDLRKRLAMILPKE